MHTSWPAFIFLENVNAKFPFSSVVVSIFSIALFISCSVTFTPSIIFSPSVYFPSPCLIFPVCSSSSVLSTNTVPSIFLASANSSCTGGAASVSSSYVSICPIFVFPGTESWSTAATVFTLLSLYTVYESLLFSICSTASLFSLYCTYI